eukprot:COSAG01_NODE_428_length_17193_cov_45.999123_16_plen_205_part_00
MQLTLTRTHLLYTTYTRIYLIPCSALTSRVERAQHSPRINPDFEPNMIRSGEGQNPPVAEGSVQDTPGPTSLESSRGGRSRSRSGSSSGKRDRDRSRDRSRSRTPGTSRSRRARGQLKTEVVDDPSGSHGGADRQASAPDGNRVVLPGLGAEAAADLAAAAAAPCYTTQRSPRWYKYIQCYQSAVLLERPAQRCVGIEQSMSRM